MTTEDDQGADGSARAEAMQRVWQMLNDQSERAKVESDVPAGLLVHEVVEATGLPRYHVRRALQQLLEERLCDKTGSRYHLRGEDPQRVQRRQRRRPEEGQPAARPDRGERVDRAAPPRVEPDRGAGGCVGLLRVHPAGYGFVQREDGADDVFVAARHRGAALDGDRVLIATWMGYKGTEGRVVRVLARGRARVTGVVERVGRHVVLVPDDPRMQVQHEHVLLPDGAGGARGGQAVVAEITRYPSHPEEPLQAKVVSTLGEPEQPRTEIAKILLCADLPTDFPDEVREAGERAPKEVREVDLCDRLDLRDRPFLTIDPETARDFDDAVCVEPAFRPGVDRLWVAVADVSHYVRPGSVLDQEARVRGTSVYLPDRVISMLPLPLSAGICSLNPDVDRLTMTVAVDVDAHGAVVGTQIAASVIRSRARLDYPGVAAALRGELRGSHARYREHLGQLRLLRQVAARLRAKRLERGALDFDLPEAKVILDEQDPERVADVVRTRQDPEVREAYRIVEDCMLAANEAVARFFSRRGLPTIYRVHEVPDGERLLAFEAMARGCGLPFDAEAARTPLYMRQFLLRLKGRPMEQALSYLLLRALQKARYDVQNVGHFGLAVEDYLHFTSPIRRYPDLLAHRLLKYQLRREGVPAGGILREPAPDEGELRRIAAESSTAERRAIEVEREVVDMYRALLMLDQVGQEYDGTIVGVTAFGIFVALESPYVEGLIRTERLGSDMTFDQRTMALHARSGRRFALGDSVRVRVEGVSVARRKIEFGLVQEARLPRRGRAEVSAPRGRARRVSQA